VSGCQGIPTALHRDVTPPIALPLLVKSEGEDVPVSVTIIPGRKG